MGTSWSGDGKEQRRHWQQQPQQGGQQAGQQAGQQRGQQAGQQAGQQLRQQFRLIPDQFRTFDELSAAMRAVGFENCDVVLAIDFTGSNREQGKRTFGGKDLHHPHEILLRQVQEAKRQQASSSQPAQSGQQGQQQGQQGQQQGQRGQPPPYAPPSHTGEEGKTEVKPPPSYEPIEEDATSWNPYQTVMSAMSTALETLSPAKRIYAVGFGDMHTEDHSIFCLKGRAKGETAVIKNNLADDCVPCYGVDEVMSSYKKALPYTTKSGPTSFVPAIDKIIEKVKTTRKYCFLFIVGDGMVSDKVENAAAVVKASHYPMSISFIGVGDGPWDDMREFDDELPERAFDNWQSVDFHTKMKECGNNPLRFAVLALQETPDQLRAIKLLKLL